MKQERRTELVTTRFTERELEAIRQVADERSCSVGAVVRWATRQVVTSSLPPIQQSQAQARPNLGG